LGIFHIITSNLAFAEWTEVFGDPRLTSALLDRLTHRCHILEFSAESYRFRQSLQRQASQAKIGDQMSSLALESPEPRTS
jgi:hypothetical protein